MDWLGTFIYLNVHFCTREKTWLKEEKRKVLLDDGSDAKRDTNANAQYP
jgi:hypothetical protein